MGKYDSLKRRQTRSSCEFHLEITTQKNSGKDVVMKFLRRLFHRPRIQIGFIDESATRPSPIRNSQFVSFFNESDCSTRRSADHFDKRLRRQRLFKAATIVTITVLCTWFVIESAQALSTF